RKIITIRIFDREEYEKECSFSLVLEEPKWLRRGLKGGFTLTGQPIFRKVHARDHPIPSTVITISEEYDD
ncbi:solute carrier family 8 (sodium/calcium exchanger), member 1, isoform CRA_d, partial [Mus musculus]